MKLKPENVELRGKIMAGIHKAVDKLIMNSAANDEKLVIANLAGASPCSYYGRCLAPVPKYRVENSYNRPNYLFLPWDVAYKGLNLKSNSISFGQSINRLTNGAFFGKDVADKRYAIFRIADYLYRRKIAE